MKIPAKHEQRRRLFRFVATRVNNTPGKLVAAFLARTRAEAIAKFRRQQYGQELH